MSITPLRNFKSALLLTFGIFALGSRPAAAQDNIKGDAEPIVSSIDPARLTYDYLVDGNLSQDDPAARKYRTLQAAYAAAPEGTEARPTVIGIKPNVYQLPGPASRGPSLSITKDFITLLGLTNNRRAVVLADNRGLMQGAQDDGYMIDVDATGFTAKNLTLINYCNTDYEYPGDPTKNLTRRSDVITQAVALQAAGDKHVYENVALLGRLDTMFLRTTRSYFKNVYIEGTDDWMGGGQISVWDNCTLVFPTGSGVMSASGIVFLDCRFEATRGMRFYKAEFNGARRPDVLINCVVPVDSPQAHVAWVRGVAAPRPSQFSLTYHTWDAAGHPAVIYDSTVGPPAFTYSRELSDRELPAFNPWNLLRAAPNAPADDWDPAGVRGKYESAGQGDLPFRISLTGDAPSIRTGGSGATIGATVTPARADQTVTWSAKSDLVSLSRTTGSSVVVTGRNTTSQAEWVAINAAASNGLYVTAHVYVEPKYIDPPAVIAKPVIRPPADGIATVDYTLDLGGRQDQSLVSWSICDTAAGTNSRVVAVSRGNQPLKALPLTPGYIGKYLKVTVQPKHNVSDPGPQVQAVSANPITATDIPSTTVSPNFMNFVTETNATYVSGLWTVLGTWAIVTGDNLVHGYGIRPSTAAYLLYQQDADCGDMQVDLTMASEKAGQGFSVPGSPADSGPRNLHADMYIKFDPRTRNGYALRFWRTTKSADKCMFQLYKIENGAGSPLDDHQVLSGVFKTTTHMTLKVTGTKLSVTASNDVDNETLALEGIIAPNRFGGAGVYWPGGSSTIYSRMAISYPPPAK
ncbi:MAG TPA: pectinesterase family protein [Verrucomicrobiae bacterium]|nr:pectinesterase family protein [Verrucomicrobiae bacterium]